MKRSFGIIAAAAAIVNASPFPQAVTQAIAPPSPAPSGCLPSYSGTFGIAVMNLTAAGQAPVTQLPDGQPGASTATVPVNTLPDGQPQNPTPVPAVSTIGDGQPQAPTTMTMGPINQIGDGQIQHQMPTATPVRTIADGQPQNPVPTATPVKTIADGQPQNPVPTANPVKTIGDGQPQNPVPSANPVKTIGDGQPQNPVPTASPVKTIGDGQPQNPVPTATPVKTIGDGQPQNPTGVVGTMPDGQPTAVPPTSNSTTGGMNYVGCKQSDSLQVTLADGILKDNLGRTGYIASNYQFQFDGPPQAGALYTAGFSVCGNGSLALGGSAVFYQCLSGNFYNLYDRYWAAQCSPITIQVINLVDC